jgi:hypothetical protein
MVIRAGTATARHLRQTQTQAERKLWNRLQGRKLDGFKLRRQFPILLPDGEKGLGRALHQGAEPLQGLGAAGQVGADLRRLAQL